MTPECARFRRQIDPALDGEAEAEARAELQRHMDRCEACARLYRSRRQLSRAVGEGATRFVPSPAFQDRIRAAVMPAATPVTPAKPSWRPSWPERGVLAGSGLALAASLALWITLPGQEDRLTHDLLSAHVRALMVDHLTDVQSSDRHTVKPWFNGKLALSPPAVDLADSGFALVGGRLDYIDDTAAAVLVYRHAAHVIDLFVWLPRDSDGNGGAQTSPRSTQRQGYHMIRWRQDHIAYALVSDLNPAELESFRTLWIDHAVPTLGQN
jgi:anti-sigma factor RsiW